MTRTSVGWNRYGQWLFTAIIAVIGCVLAAGGAKLIYLGGSAYYLMAGVTLLACAAVIWRGYAFGATGYALLLFLTTLWSVAEAGWDAWAMAARLVAPTVLAIPFAFHFWRLPRPDMPPWPSRCIWLAIACAIAPLIFSAATADKSGSAAQVKLVINGVTMGATDGWPQFGGTSAGQRFSQADAINPSNVGELTTAWTYDTGAPLGTTSGTLELTPIQIGDRLYGCNQENVVFALDVDSGRQIWRYDPRANAAGASAVRTCRGVAYARVAAGGDCAERIISTTFDARLIALDARTGAPCRAFGNRGAVDLKKGMGVVDAGTYYGSSAPTIVLGNVIIGGWVADNLSLDMPSGVVRAYDVRTGAFSWAWDVGRPGVTREPRGTETYTRSTPNSWGPMSADEALGMVFVPTGNAAGDFWGGKRTIADDRYNSSVVALNAQTGFPLWSFQTTRHDLWDYDLGAQPTLVDFPVPGRAPIPAVIQGTKRGDVFVLDRLTGRPLVQVANHAAPSRGATLSERVAPTQPFSIGLPNFAGDRLTERDMWGVTPLDQLWCRIRFRELRYDGMFTPPGLTESLTYPSIGGGINWGGIAVDPLRNIAIVNSMYFGTIVQLIERPAGAQAGGAKTSHSATDYGVLPQTGAPYAVMQSGLMSPIQVPCNKPPYGRLSAIDLNSRKLLWSRPIGSARDTGPFRIPSGLPLPMGMPMFGGALVTKSGLTFIAATQDRTFRAFATASGKLLWSSRLPAGGQSNPMTYRSPRTGRQFVVIAAGGHKVLGSPIGNSLLAFALPIDKK